MEDVESTTPGAVNKRRCRVRKRKRSNGRRPLGLTPTQTRQTVKKWLHATGKTLDEMVLMLEKGQDLDFDLPPGMVFEDAKILLKTYRRLLHNAASAKRSRVNAKQRIQDLETTILDLRAEKDDTLEAKKVMIRLQKQCEELNTKVGRLESKVAVWNENLQELQHRLPIVQEWVGLSSPALPPPTDQEQWFSPMIFFQEISTIHSSALNDVVVDCLDGETPPLMALEGDDDYMSLVDVGIVPTQGSQDR